MDTKISPEFWSHRDIEDTSSEIKLTLLWLLTNSRLSICGYAEVTEKRFCFETGLQAECLARALDALPDTFRRFPKGYWVRTFIKWQIGVGEPLVMNKLSHPLARDILQLPADVAAEVLKVYPELNERIASINAASKDKPSRRGGQGVREEKEKSKSREGAEEEQSSLLAASEADTVAHGVENPDERSPGYLDPVITYAAELNLPTSQAEMFFDHYAANGWKQGGRTPLKSWRAALRNWARRYRDEKKPFGSNGAAVTSPFTQLLPPGVDPFGPGGAYPQT